MINKCTFIGNLGKDPDYKVLESGHKVASFSIACSRKVKKKTRKMERQRNIRNGFPLWPGTIWPKSSASWPAKVRRYMWKGSSAHEATRQKEPEKKRYVSEIWARDFRLLGRKAESSSAPLPTSPDDFGSQPAPASAPSPAQPAQAAPQQPTQGTLNMTDEKDDLPF